MKYKINFDQFPDYVCIQTEGEALPGDFDKLLTDAVESPNWKTGSRMLIDHRKLIISNLTPKGMQEIKNIVIKHSKKLGNGPCAFLVNDAAGFGMARMYELSGGETLHREVGVFYEFEKAVNWLKAR